MKNLAKNARIAFAKKEKILNNSATVIAVDRLYKTAKYYSLFPTLYPLITKINGTILFKNGILILLRSVGVCSK